MPIYHCFIYKARNLLLYSSRYVGLRFSSPFLSLILQIDSIFVSSRIRHSLSRFPCPSYSRKIFLKVFNLLWCQYSSLSTITNITNLFLRREKYLKLDKGSDFYRGGRTNVYRLTYDVYSFRSLIYQQQQFESNGLATG